MTKDNKTEGKCCGFCCPVDIKGKTYPCDNENCICHSLLQAEREKAYLRGYAKGVDMQLTWEHLTEEERAQILKDIDE